MSTYQKSWVFVSNLAKISGNISIGKSGPMVLIDISSPLSYLDNLVWQSCADAARNDVLFHCPAQSPVITGTATIHRVVVVVSLDHGDVALRHPVVCVEDTHEAGHTLPDAAAPRDNLHARPELVLIDAHQ